jgi:hypothetical protein
VFCLLLLFFFVFFGQGQQSSSKNEDSPVQSSPETTTTSEADRSTRRALILKMAKARMQKHKRDLSEPPILNKNSGAMQINLDLD